MTKQANASAVAINSETKDKTKEEAKSKISFSIKGRATASEKPLATATEASPTKRTSVPASPLVAKAVPKSSNYVGNERIDDRSRRETERSRSERAEKRPEPPKVRKEIVRRKRLKERPELSEDFVASESVYYRKTGNESVVGSGTYGKVYKAIHVYTKNMVALKKIRMEGERDGVSKFLTILIQHTLT